MANDEHAQKFLEIEESASQIMETLARWDERSTNYENALQALRALSGELSSAASELRQVAANAGAVENEAKQALGQAAESIAATAHRVESAIADVASNAQDMRRELEESLSASIATMESAAQSAQSRMTQDLNGLKRVVIAGFIILGALGVASLVVALGVVS